MSAPAAGPEIAAVPPRGDAREAWVGEAGSLTEVPNGASVGISSLCQSVQLLAHRPDLCPVEMEGDIDVRLQKLHDGEVDALVLAVAGLSRVGHGSEIAFVFDIDQMVPAARDLSAESMAMTTLEADCSSPVGIHAREIGGRLVIDGFVGLPDGSDWIRDRLEGDLSQPEAVGRQLARRMIAAGARDILDRATEATADT